MVAEGNGGQPEDAPSPDPRSGSRPSESSAVTLIAHPAAGGGRVGRDLPEVERTIRSLGFDVRTLRAETPPDARALAGAAVEEGERYLVAFGDDHLVHHVINGVMQDGAPRAPDAVLAVIPAGADSDMARVFGLPEEPQKAASRLAGDVVYPMDVGLIVCRDRDGSERTEYFANIAEAGMGADLVARAGRLPFRSARTRYFWSFWLTLARYRRPTVIVVSGSRRFEGKASNVLIGNGQYQAGGVRISPRGFPGDGFFEVLIMTGPRSDHFTMLPKMFQGEHLPHPHVVEYRVKTVSVEADRPIAVQADGEPVGFTPLAIKVIPQAINVKL